MNNIPKNHEESDDIGSYHCSSNREHDHSTISHKNGKNNEQYIQANVLMVMRHSERLDDCCTGWIEKCNRTGKYEPFDLNMPSRLPVSRPLRDFYLDTCLTRSGIVLAQMVGRSLQLTDNAPDVIYCSPSLRCIQTAQWVREMSGSKALLRVEPGIFEDFSPRENRVFLTPLQRHIFPVDKKYRPFLSMENLLSRNESKEDYNERIRQILRNIVEQYEVVMDKKDLKVLVVAHASTVDMSIGLLRDPPRYLVGENIQSIAIPVPYCSVAYHKMKKGMWIPQPHVIPSITYEHLTTKYNPHFVHRK